MSWVYIGAVCQRWWELKIWGSLLILAVVQSASGSQRSWTVGTNSCATTAAASFASSCTKSHRYQGCNIWWQFVDLPTHPSSSGTSNTTRLQQTGCRHLQIPWALCCKPTPPCSPVLSRVCPRSGVSTALDSYMHLRCQNLSIKKVSSVQKENVSSLNVKITPRPSCIVRPHWSFLLNLVIKFSLSWESVKINGWIINP